MLASWKKSYDQPRQYIKKQRHYFANKSLFSQSYGFSSGHYGHESWTIKKAEHQRIDSFELWCWWRLLRVPLDCKEIKLVNPKGNQSWIFIGGTDAEDEAQIHWPIDEKNWLIGKDPDAWKDWRQEEKGTTEDKMVGWHHWLDGHEFEKAPGAWWWTGKPGVLQSTGSQRRIQLSDWTELNWRRSNQSILKEISPEYSLKGLMLKMKL